MDDLLDEFKSESLDLLSQMSEILDDIDGEFAKRSRLEDFGQIVDRIMGGAKSLALAMKSAPIETIGSYAEVCKIIGYKGSQLKDNEQFFNIVLACLFDAVEMLESMVSSLGTEQEGEQTLGTHLLDRLIWISNHFDSNLRGTVAIDKKAAEGHDIDSVLKELRHKASK